MNFEPQKFFIGLVDFFAILMPGALLVYVGKDWVGSMLLGQQSLRLDGAEAWMVFLLASYLLGHFAFLLGTMLDDWPYEPLRNCTYWGQVGRLAEGKGLRDRRWRALATSSWFFGKNADAAVMQAQRMKTHALQALSAEGAINAYQWCKARLSKDHPEGLAAVQRFEAGSKFFRSVFVVLAVLALIYLFKWQLMPALVCAGFLLPTLWCYIDQRFKATQQAYWSVITLEGLKGPATPAASSGRRPDGLTHAGGVVFCMHGEVVKYLLVQASADREQWVLPKGHIEPGEKPRETAVREVKEETGYWARVIQRIADVRFGDDADSTMVRFYLMEAVESEECAKKGKPWPAEERQHAWLALAEAQRKASFEDTRTLLEKAEKRRMEEESKKGPQVMNTTADDARVASAAHDPNRLE